MRDDDVRDLDKHVSRTGNVQIQFYNDFDHLINRNHDRGPQSNAAVKVSTSTRVVNRNGVITKTTKIRREFADGSVEEEEQIEETS